MYAQYQFIFIENWLIFFQHHFIRNNLVKSIASREYL